MFGSQPPPDQKVDYAVRFSAEELNVVLLRAVIDRVGAPSAAWLGHVSFQTTFDPPAVTATVSAWRAEQVDNPDGSEGALKPKETKGK